MKFSELTSALQKLIGFGGVFEVAESTASMKLTGEGVGSAFVPGSGSWKTWDLFNQYLPPAWLPPRYAPNEGQIEPNGFVISLSANAMAEIEANMKLNWSLGRQSTVELHKLSCAIVEILKGRAAGAPTRSVPELAAVEALASLAQAATSSVHSLPETLVKLVATRHPSFPVNYVPHPVARRELQHRAQTLGIGLKCPLNLGRNARWNPGNHFAQLAWLLLNALVSIRMLGRWVGDMGEAEMIAPSFPLFEEWGLMLDVEGVGFASAAALPELSRGTVDQWWHEAKRILEKVCPDLHRIPQFKKVAPLAYKGKRNSKIRDRIAEAFRSLVRA